MKLASGAGVTADDRDNGFPCLLFAESSVLYMLVEDS